MQEVTKEFHIIIPARFASTRLPGKPLLEIKGKTLIQRVYERALQCQATSVSIATDDERIAVCAESFGAKVCMTNREHPTGTDRLAEASELLGLSDNDIVVNFQGDEPLLPASAVHLAVKAMFNNTNASMATLCTPILNYETVLNPNVVKVVLDHKGFALYFSRAPIPFDRARLEGSSTISASANQYYFHHLGLYAYRVSTLKKYYAWEPSLLETTERLEQLRFLYHGEKIHVSCIEDPLPPGVDTEADLKRIIAIFERESDLVK